MYKSLCTHWSAHLKADIILVKMDDSHIEWISNLLKYIVYDLRTIECVIENCLKARPKCHPDSWRVCTAQNTYCQVHSRLNGAGEDRAIVFLWEVAGGNGISTSYGISNVPHSGAGGGRTCVHVQCGEGSFVLFTYTCNVRLCYQCVWVLGMPLCTEGEFKGQSEASLKRAAWAPLNLNMQTYTCGF